MSIDEIQRAIAETGFFCVDDPALGERIKRLEENQVQFTTSKEEGWEFCKHQILENTLIQNFLESSYNSCRLGYYCRIASDPGHIFQFRKGSGGTDIILVQIWGKGKRAVYYAGSHLITPTSYRAANRLWEVVKADLSRAGINGCARVFENGGFAILDARLSLEMPDGDPITAAFVGANEEKLVDTELAKWPRLPMPDYQTQMIARGNKNKIGVHE